VAALPMFPMLGAPAHYPHLLFSSNLSSSSSMKLYLTSHRKVGVSHGYRRPWSTSDDGCDPIPYSHMAFDDIKMLRPNLYHPSVSER
jgi:hypothetical protein